MCSHYFARAWFVTSLLYYYHVGTLEGVTVIHPDEGSYLPPKYGCCCLNCNIALGGVTKRTGRVSERVTRPRAIQRVSNMASNSVFFSKTAPSIVWEQAIDQANVCAFDLKLGCWHLTELQKEDNPTIRGHVTIVLRHLLGLIYM